MNRKRVMESRAKKFDLLRKDGKSAEEAAKLASISPESAKRALERKYGNVKSRTNNQSSAKREVPQNKP